ncbi:uncharacterized protein TNCV_215951 [Trichonephila clavipes]|nr:uncharacterized protein TNCV_215951 [Trichonephila clavipes]
MKILLDVRLGRDRYPGHPPKDTLNPLRTYEQVLLDFTQDELAILTLNFQSLRTHQTDFNDVISQNPLLMLQEPWLGIETHSSLSNFDCCVQFNRAGHRATGVAIYRKQKNSHVVTPHMDITYRQTSALGIVIHDIGDISAAECLFENGQTVISVGV